MLRRWNGGVAEKSDGLASAPEGEGSIDAQLASERAGRSAARDDEEVAGLPASFWSARFLHSVQVDALLVHGGVDAARPAARVLDAVVNAHREGVVRGELEVELVGGRLRMARPWQRRVATFP